MTGVTLELRPTGGAWSTVVDNTAPSTSTLTNPANTLSGSVALSGTAADAGSGVAAWTAQLSVAGANS